MNIQPRPYNGDADRQKIYDFLVMANAQSAQQHYWHVGDLIWGMYQNTLFDPYTAVGLWEGENDELLGFTWREASNSLEWQVHPRLRGEGGLEQQMLDWAIRDAIAPADDPWFWVKTPSSDQGTVAFLERNGFMRDEFHYLLLYRDLHIPIPTSELPEGWTVRSVGGEDEWHERVETHREVWYPSRVTLEAYGRMRAIPGYNADLDIVAVTPDGTFAGYCICWLDRVNRYGEFEPVGTRPAHRGRGIGKAVLNEGLRRLHNLGAERAFVVSVASNVASKRLYESVGFIVGDTEYLYCKPLIPKETNSERHV